MTNNNNSNNNIENKACPVLCEYHEVPVKFSHVERIGNCTIGVYLCPECAKENRQFELEGFKP